MATVNSTNNGLSGTTGTGSFVGSTSPTLTTPALGTPASGILTNCTGYTEANLSISDITTNNASTSNHGFLKKLDNNAAHYMDGTGAWSSPAGTSFVLITTGTASSSASVALTGMTGYTYYRVYIDNIAPATDAVDLRLRVSTDGGSNYASGASDYAYTLENVNGTTYAAAQSTAAAQIIVGTSADNGSIKGCYVVDIFNPNGAAAGFYCTGNGWHVDSGGSNYRRTTFAARYTSATAVNAIQFLYSSGNISTGNFRLYGVV